MGYGCWTMAPSRETVHLTCMEARYGLLNILCFWISKYLFPKGKATQPKNTRAKTQNYRKTDRTSPKNLGKGTSPIQPTTTKTCKAGRKRERDPPTFRGDITPKAQPTTRAKEPRPNTERTQPATKPLINHAQPCREY